MLTISGVSPYYSSSADGGESVEITGTGLDAVTGVTFGPFDGVITAKSDTRLQVTAPHYRPGWGGHHGEVLVWVDPEPTHTGVIWTWAGKTLDELGGPMDQLDEAIGLASVPAYQWKESDPLDQLLRPPDAAQPTGPAPHYAAVDSFEPEVVPRAGGWITLHGTGFTGATAITIGSFPCPQFEVRSDTLAVVLAPHVPIERSTLPVTPIVWHGEIASLIPGNPPNVVWETRVSPTITIEGTPPTVEEAVDAGRDEPLWIHTVEPRGSATAAGGEKVTIRGKGFTTSTLDYVYIGSYFAIRDFTVVSDSELVFTAPAWADRQKDVVAGTDLGIEVKSGKGVYSGLWWKWGGHTHPDAE